MDEKRKYPVFETFERYVMYTFKGILRFTLPELLTYWFHKDKK